MMLYLARVLGWTLLCILMAHHACPASMLQSDPPGKPGMTSRSVLLTPVVKTPSGPVRGEMLPSTLVFRGIPYALQPVGPLRWKPPVPARRHQDVLDATHFAPACCQLSDPRGGIILSPRQQEMETGDEGCLSLNVWAPRHPKEPSVPVMVFIHGGGFK